MSKKYISVFVPTYNGEKYIGELIEAVLHQNLPQGYALEFIIIDSGSRDNTVTIIKKHYLKKVIFSEIPNSEFGHGKTRQRAAEMAKGDFILYLSQDATPSDYNWLINMIEPFFVSDRVGCVFGRQIPRLDAVPTIKREVATAFAGIGAPDSISLQRHQSLVDAHETNQLNSFFSDVNSAVRRKLLLTEIPFRDVLYAEDQALAKDMQKAGYLKAYAPQGAVWHSNEYTAAEFYKRKFDEYTGLQESVGRKIIPSRKKLLLGWIKPTLRDFQFIRHDHDYSKKLKLKWLLLSPLYNFNVVRAEYTASLYINDHEKRKKLSLEETIARKK